MNLKSLLKKIIPLRSLAIYHKLKKSNEKSIFYGKKIEDVFNQIYTANHWTSKKSISGTGSEKLQTKTLIIEINSLLQQLEIKSVLDIPCGDFIWMKEVNLQGIVYTGGDIVTDLIDNNQKEYCRKNVSFQQMNLISDPLPESDIIISRDCLVHLSYKDIYSSLKNIKFSGCKYLLATTFTNRRVNSDITTGDWRTLNLQKKPFNFPPPILLINENCSEINKEDNTKYSDKSLGLWAIKDINLPSSTY